MNAQHIDVEVVGPARWSDVRRVRLAALADTPDAFGARLDEERAQPTSWWQERLRMTDRSTILATLSAPAGAPEPVGLAVVGPRWDDDTAAGLFAVWVAPAGRGRGVGDALLRAAVEQARKAGATRLLLDVGDENHAAIALYERHGFVPTGRTGSLPSPREHVLEHERALVLDPP